MKKLYPPHIILLLSLFALVHGILPAQYWTQIAGGATVDEGYDIAIDGSGNVYTVGYFSGSASFGGTTLTSSGSTDIFVTKVNSSGVFQWAVKAGGSGTDRGLSIDVDGSGNCVITGFFNATADFSGTSVTSSGAQDVFIAKYNSAGVLSWVVSDGGSDADIGNGIALDNSGNVIVTGEFKGTAAFGTSSLTSSNNSTDVFTVKYSSAGAFSWVEHGTSKETARGIDVTTGPSGDIYITGQFSDTIQFDQNHPNTMFNVVYVVKYNSSGVEQWFTLAGGATSNISKAIASDASGNVYVTGDFTGDMTVFTGSNPVISGTYTNRIFLFRLSSAGAVGWTQSASSDSPLTATCINLDGSSNVYIGGTFECRLDEYSDQYGAGTFNSVGNNDIFVAKYSSSGAWDYSRNLGSRSDDYCLGIDVNGSGNIHFTGSFLGTINIPYSQNFLTNSWTTVDCGMNTGYCNDSDYGSFQQIPSTGNADIIIANAIDPNREPYDYYDRSASSGCNRDVVRPCIDPGCPDTASDCNSVTVQAFSWYCETVGPSYNWSWSGGGSLPSMTYYTEGIHSVTRQTADGCFQASDSIYIDIVPSAQEPRISDDVVINTNALQLDVQPISICGPQIVTLTASDYGNDSIYWIAAGSVVGSTSSLQVSQSGVYSVFRIDSNGCTSVNTVTVDIYDPLDSFQLAFNGDSVFEVCEGENFLVWAYDTVENPTGQYIAFDSLNQEYSAITTTYTFNPPLPPPNFTVVDANTGLYVFVEDSSAAGSYTVDIRVIRAIPCDTDTHTISVPITINVLPNPTLPQYNYDILGNQFFCPGDNPSELVAVAALPHVWSGPAGSSVSGSIADTVDADIEGEYSILSLYSDTNSFGCISDTAYIATLCVREKPQPVIDATSTILCPNDSVTLIASFSFDPINPCPLTFSPVAGFTWEGPNGVLPGNGPTINVSASGQYFCTFNDGDSCDLLSNTVTINQYTTPSLVVSGNPVICDNDSIIISVITNSNSTIEWQAPLTGDSTQQVVYAPGTYVCKITSCNIETFAEITIVPSDVEAEITVDGILCIDSTTTLIGSQGMANYSWWPTSETNDSILAGDSGAFVLTTMDSNGCVAVSDTLFLTIDQEVTEISVNGYPVICEGESTTLFGNSNMNSYLWSPGNQTSASIIVDTAGTYVLTTVDSNGCRGVSDPFDVTTPPTYAPVIIGGSTSFCEGEYVTLISQRTSGLASYVWLPGLDSAQTITVFDPGTYTLLTVDTFGCEAHSDSIQVTVQANVLLTPVVEDTVICAGQSIELTASTNIGDILWYLPNDTTLLNTGSTFVTPILNENTSYYIYAQQFVCNSDVTSVFIEVVDCQSIEIPNVFSPNGDGENDIWRTNLEEHECFTCSIYNRWGVLIHTYEFQEMGWDGTVAVSGEDVSEGVYFYLVEYCLFNDDVIQHRGTITVVR